MTASNAPLLGRRAALGGLLATAPLASVRAAPAITDAIVAAGKKEGAVVFHSSIELGLCEKMIAGFNKRYPDIRVQLERTGAERILQRINQEYASNIFAADVVESSDTGTFFDWAKRGWLARFVPDEVVAKWPAEERDPDGRFASIRGSLSVMGYNTKLIKAEDAPRGFADLLQPKWRMRMVKAHPSYSGSILNSTYMTAKALGWDYFDKLAKQRVMQVQSATEPPKKVAQGERPVMVDGSEYVLLMMRDSGVPIEPIYAVEGSPIFSGQATVMEKAAHPNAARLLHDYFFSRECQQMMSDDGGLRSFHPEVTDKPGRVHLKDIKLLRAPATELLAGAEETKKRYLTAFGV